MSKTKTLFDYPAKAMDQQPKPRNKGGRPADRLMSFGARLLAIRGAYSDRHARRLLTTEGIEHLGSRDWFIVGHGIDCGLRTTEQFDGLLRELKIL